MPKHRDRRHDAHTADRLGLGPKTPKMPLLRPNRRNGKPTNRCFVT